ncbi:MAG: hypothetical protein JW776_05855 [Candidatus Lokiarchaeota archaeon]|nr:hypothetical protein [Candidatus Lokiarchaeota archaeon]
MSDQINGNRFGLMENGTKLVFVYNADGGTINGIKDYFHKIFSPSTYDCNLCGISFGLGGMKRDWKTYIEELTFPVEFLHRDEFKKRYPNKQKEFPSAWIERNNNIELLISSNEMNQPKSLEDLISLTTNKLKEKHLIK